MVYVLGAGLLVVIILINLLAYIFYFISDPCTEGKKAYFNNQSLNDNPYNCGSVEHTLWEDNWKNAWKTDPNYS